MKPAHVVLAVATVLGLSACGVGVEDDPREVQPPIEFQTAAPTASSPPAGNTRITQRLYFLRDGNLVPVTRRVTSAPTVASLLAELVAGPTQAESNAGLTSALLGNGVVASVTTRGSLIDVELVAGTADTGRTDEIPALGQIVCTLTGSPGVTGVRFTSDGQAISVPRDDASLTQGPLVCEDYEALIAER